MTRLSIVVVLFTLVFSAVVCLNENQFSGSLNEILVKQNEILEHLKAQEAVINSLQQCATKEEIEDLQNKLKADGECSLFGRGHWINRNPNHGVQSIPCPSMLQDAAYNKTTCASPIHGNYIGGQAVDNSDATEYHSDLLDEPWWMVDLGAVRTIFHIIILPRQHITVSQRFSNIEIRIGETQQTTGDFSSFTLLQFYKGPYIMGEGRLMYTFCSSITGRYLSVQIKGAKDYLEIMTFQAIALRI